MGAIAALIALGGIVALAAYSAGNEERRGPSGGSPLPSGGGVPSLSLPSGSSSTATPQPTPVSHTPSSTGPSGPSGSMPAHCPPGLNMADPTARALCAPSAGPGTPDASAPIVPVSTPSATPAASNVPPDLVERVRAFMASDPSPEQIEQLATQLETAGLPDAARQLREVAAARRRARAQGASSPSPTPTTAPTAPSRPASAGPSSPAGTPGTSSSSATEPGSSSRPAGSGEPPSGRQLAVEAADALRTRLAEIQRLTRAFQDAAFIANDGQYGPMTRAALTYWAGRTAPRPWVGSGSPRYRGMQSVERGDGSPAAQHAERTARALFRALLEPEGDAKPMLERFQRAVGLTVDGKYGRQTRAALGRLGVANPPRAFRRSRRRGSSRRRSG